MNLTDNLLFDGISIGESRRLYSLLRMRRVEVKKGEIAYKFSSKNQEIGYVVSGLAKIIKYDEQGNQSLLEILHNGSLFGNAFAYALRGSEYIVAVASTDLVVDYIPQSELMKGCGQSCDHRHKLIVNVLSLMSKKTTGLSERIEIMSNHTIKGKLLCYFNTLSSRFGSKSFEMELSLSALAEYLAVDRSAMMREIKKLKDDKVVEIKGKSVTLL